MRRLRTDYEILWANSIGTRKPQLNSFTVKRIWEKLRGWGKGVQSIDHQMWVTDLPMVPFLRNSWAQRLNDRFVGIRLRSILRQQGLDNPIVVTTLPYVLPWIDRIPRRALVYYVTDDYSAWPGADRDAMLQADTLMSERADLIVAVSRDLQRRYSSHARAEYMPHGVDVSHFSRALTCSPVSELQHLSTPRIGFFGLIYEKLDFSLLSAVAQRFPQASLVMIGPTDYCEDSFSQLPNVHFAGAQPYDSLPNWIAGLDVLLMPYVLDEMILKSCPLKMRECLASGKPTVSVDVPEVRRMSPHVRVAANQAEFLTHIQCILDDKATMEDHLARQKLVQNDDWGCRAAVFDEMLQTV